MAKRITAKSSYNIFNNDEGESEINKTPQNKPQHKNKINQLYFLMISFY